MNYTGNAKGLRICAIIWLILISLAGIIVPATTIWARWDFNYGMGWLGVAILLACVFLGFFGFFFFSCIADIAQSAYGKAEKQNTVMSNSAKEDKSAVEAKKVTLVALRESGALTQEEFDAAMKKLLEEG